MSVDTKDNREWAAKLEEARQGIFETIWLIIRNQHAWRELSTGEKSPAEDDRPPLASAEGSFEEKLGAIIERRAEDEWLVFKLAGLLNTMKGLFIHDDGFWAVTELGLPPLPQELCQEIMVAWHVGEIGNDLTGRFIKGLCDGIAERMAERKA